MCSWLFVLCVPLSRFQRLTGVGVVLTSLALDGCSGMVSDDFQTQKRVLDPGESVCRESLGECDLDCWEKGVDV